MMKFCKKLEKYYKKHPYFNSTIHFFLGAGVAFLITYPIVRTHPVRWGVASLGIFVIGKLYAYKNK